MEFSRIRRVSATKPVPEPEDGRKFYDATRASAGSRRCPRMREKGERKGQAKNGAAPRNCRRQSFHSCCSAFSGGSGCAYRRLDTGWEGGKQGSSLP